MYCEHDYVLKAPGVEEILGECGYMGMRFSPENEKTLREDLEDARRQEAPRGLPFLNLLAGWDPRREEYCLVVKNMYDPRNLLETLYERLIMEKDEDPGPLVDAYLGVIEERENVSLAEARENLKTLAAQMRKVLDLYGDGEYSEQELIRLDETLAKAYFEPLRELLEGLIVEIAGN